MVIAAEEPPPPDADATAAALLVLRAVAALANNPAATALPSPGDASAADAEAGTTSTRTEAVATLRAAARVSRAWRAYAAEAAEALTTLVPCHASALRTLPRCHPRVTTLCLSRLRLKDARKLLLQEELSAALELEALELAPPQGVAAAADDSALPTAAPEIYRDDNADEQDPDDDDGGGGDGGSAANAPEPAGEAAMTEDGHMMLRFSGCLIKTIFTLMGHLMTYAPALRVLDASGNDGIASVTCMMTFEPYTAEGEPYLSHKLAPLGGNTTLTLLDLSATGLEHAPVNVLPRLQPLLPAARILTAPRDDASAALPAIGAPRRLSWSFALRALDDLALRWAQAVEEGASPPRDVALLGATAGIVASPDVRSLRDFASGGDDAGASTDECAPALIRLMTLARPDRDAAWRPARRGLLNVHVCSTPPNLLKPDCMGSTLRDAAAMCVAREGGFSTMRLYDGASCVAAAVAPQSAEERAAQEEAEKEARTAAPTEQNDDARRTSGPAADSGVTIRSGAFETRLTDALVASANDIEATPLATLRAADEGGAAGPRLRAVVLPLGARVAGGDGDEALRWAPPRDDTDARS